LAYREELEREEQIRDKTERKKGELTSKDFFKHSSFHYFTRRREGLS